MNFCRRDRQDAGAGSDIECPAHRSHSRQAIKCQQAATGGPVMAGAKGLGCLDKYRLLAWRNSRGRMGPGDHEAAGMDGWQSGQGQCDPIGLGCDSR